MKIAYLGFDLGCLKTDSAIRQQSAEVVYFLKEKKQAFAGPSVFETDIYVDHLMISGDLKKRSPQGEQKFQAIKKQFNKIADVISIESQVSTLPEETATANVESIKAPSVFNLNLIRDIQFDSRKKKIILEIEKQGVEEFDLLLAEAHPFLADFFEDRKIKFFKDSVSITYVWSAVNFEIDYLKPIEPFRNSRSFFLILDSSRETVIDNWMYCCLDKNHLSVWSFLPSHQVGNTEYLNFYIDRIRQSLSEKFRFLYLKNYQNSTSSSVGALQSSVRTRIPQAFTVPNFHFSSGPQIQSYFEQKIGKKIKAIRKVAGEKYD